MDNSLTSPLLDDHNKERNKGGWASAVYLLGAEVLERFAMLGMSANLITYFTNVLHEPTATAAKYVNIYTGVIAILPILGAFVADAYLGRFKTILISSLIYVMGLVMLTLSVWIVPWEAQHVPFFLSLYLVGVGQGGQKPCAQTFGADQFDETSLDEKKAKSAFFNWWYFGICLGGSAGTLIISFVQENVGWVAGFAIPTVAIAAELIVLLLGRRSYRQHIPNGSPLTRILQVFVAAISKRHLCVSEDIYTQYYKGERHVAWKAQPSGQTLSGKSKFKFLDKATIIDEMDETSAVKNNWRLCTFTQVEEVKQFLVLIPIWLTCLMYTMIFAQWITFFTKQGRTMDTSIGNSFHVPPASLQISTGLTALLFVPIYDKCFVRVARSYTGFQSGITTLQRIGVGIFFAVSAMVVAALVETRRIRIAREHGLLDQPDGIVPMRVWWLLPQYIILGVANVFAYAGMQELFYDQMPEDIRSIGAAMQHSAFGVGSLLSSVIISIVQYVSAQTGEGWLVDNPNRAHLHYYYWLLAGLTTCNLCAFISVAKCFVYKKVYGDCSSL